MLLASETVLARNAPLVPQYSSFANETVVPLNLVKSFLPIKKSRPHAWVFLDWCEVGVIFDRVIIYLIVVI